MGSGLIQPEQAPNISVLYCAEPTVGKFGIAVSASQTIPRRSHVKLRAEMNRLGTEIRKRLSTQLSVQAVKWDSTSVVLSSAHQLPPLPLLTYMSGTRTGASPAVMCARSSQGHRKGNEAQHFWDPIDLTLSLVCTCNLEHFSKIFGHKEDTCILYTSGTS